MLGRKTEPEDAALKVRVFRGSLSTGQKRSVLTISSSSDKRFYKRLKSDMGVLATLDLVESILLELELEHNVRAPDDLTVSCLRED
jgi:hypothetical protein